MNDRCGETWEFTGVMNGVRMLIVLRSRISKNQFGDVFTIHKVLQINGKKMGRFLDYIEDDGSCWERDAGKVQLGG